MQLSIDQVRHIRADNQRLCADRRSEGAAAAVRRLTALQSQEWPSAQLAIAARTSDITQDDPRREREIERSFVLTWTLRGTLHLVAANDIGWQLALFGPRAIRGTNSRYQQLGLSEQIRDKALDAIGEILAGQVALTRSELSARLAAYNIPVAGQAIHHLVRYAALRGRICLGPERDGALTYVLLSEWLPDFRMPESSTELLPPLARRYLSAYGPASSEDLSRWAGISASQAKKAFAAIASDCADVEFPGGRALILADQLDQLPLTTEQPVIRFLPRYDNYLLAYHSRDFMLDAAYAKRVHPGGGLIRACVLLDGQAVANWRLEKTRASTRIHIEPFDGDLSDLRPDLEAEAQRLSKFLSTDIELRIESA